MKVMAMTTRFLFLNAEYNAKVTVLFACSVFLILWSVAMS